MARPSTSQPAGHHPRTVLVVVALVLVIPFVTAHTGEEAFNETEELLASGTPCSDLTDDQLAAIGDYYMEQMHPGELHDLMDQHLGGEGSENLRAAHITMAERFYCGTASTQSGFWGWMPGMHGMWGVSMGGGVWMTAVFWVLVLVLLGLGVVYLAQILLRQDVVPGGNAETGDDAGGSA